MAQLLILVLDKEDAIRDVLKAWKKAGAPGMTMLESTGTGRRVSMLRGDLPAGAGRHPDHPALARCFRHHIGAPGHHVVRGVRLPHRRTDHRKPDCPLLSHDE